MKIETWKFKNVILNARKRLRKALNPNGSVLVICICVVMIWRAVRDLCDLYIFPDNKLLSDIVCFVLWVWILIIHDWNLKDLL